MTIAANFGLTDADSARYTLEASMTMKQWREVRTAFREIGYSTPSSVCGLVASIDKLVENAQKHFQTYESRPAMEGE